MQAIWRAAEQGTDPLLYLLILDLVRISGIRRCSAIRLNMEDINWQTGKSLIRGKGQRVYPVWISHQILERMLSLYLQRTGQTEKDLPTLMRHWCRRDYDSTSGSGGTPALLTRRGCRVSNGTMEALIETVNKRLAPGVLSQRFILHSLRHTLLTQVSQTFDEAAASGFAGHRNNHTPLAEATRDYVASRDARNVEIFAALFGPEHTVGLLPLGD
jgi:integrase